MLVVLAAGDGADAVTAGAAAAHDVLPPSVPPTHSSSSIPGPSSAPQSSPMREPTPENLDSVRNNMHKAFPLPGESFHWQYKFPLPVEGVPTARRMEISLPGVFTAMMKKLPVKDRWQLH
nr:hypothetical protein [Tanacetum cinerariifolium]